MSSTSNRSKIATNRIPATASPKAYFEKANEARSGSKGDYICLRIISESQPAD
jgi:hypothetical protein